MPKQIVGSVYWIENNRQTSRVVDVSEAFSDSVQAKAQILYAESSVDKRQLRLARFAYRQFQGKRYRIDSKVEPRRTTEVHQERISKPSRKKPLQAKSTKRPVGRKVARKVPKVASQRSGDELSIARLLKKAVGRIAKKALKVASKPSRSEPSNGKPSKKPAVKKVARKAAKVTSKSSKREPSKANLSKKASERKVARKVPEVASQHSRNQPSKAKPSKKPEGKKAARKVTVRKSEKKLSNRR